MKKDNILNYDEGFKDCKNGFSGETKVWVSIEYYAGYYKTASELSKSKESFITDTFDLKRNYFRCNKASIKPIDKTENLVEIVYGRFEEVQFKKVKCTLDCQFLILINSDCGNENKSSSNMKWVKASDLEKGMQIVTEGSSMYVYDKSIIECNDDIYYLSSENNGSFAIDGGIIVRC